MQAEEVVVEDVVPFEKAIEPFDWEDYLYESWLEEQHRQKKNRPAAGISV
jgi:hypothetical protein